MPETDGGPRPAAARAARRGRGHADALGDAEGAAPDRRPPRCSGTRCTRSPRSRPSTSPSSSGTARDQVRAEVDALAGQLGRPVRRRRAGAAARHRARRAAAGSTRCRPGSTGAGGRDLRRRAAARARHAARAARRARRRRRGRHAADRRARRPHRLRPGAARRGRRGHRRSSSRPTRRPSSARSARSTAGCTPSTPRSSPRACSGLASHNAQGELYLTDLVAIAAAQGRPVRRASRAPTPGRSQGVNDRVQLAAGAAPS